MAEGTGVTAISRLTGASKVTILRLLDRQHWFGLNL
jgi:hypothetical protein